MVRVAALLLLSTVGIAGAREPAPAGTCMPYATLQRDYLAGAGAQQVLATTAGHKLEVFKTRDGHLMAVVTDVADRACIAFDGWQKAVPVS